LSSSNQVRIALIKETTYGVTPGAGNFETARFTSESLSGTPETTESQTIRTDRLSSGQVVTGLTVSGDVSMELAKEDALDLMMESSMQSSWASDTPIAVDLTMSATADTLTRASGDWNTDVVVGDVLTLTSFTDTNNNTQVMVTVINSATEIAIVGPDTLVDEVGTGTSFVVADKISIGTTQSSMSVEKSFQDLTTKAINYRGMLAGNMNLNVNYGEIANVSFTMQGNDHEPVSAAADFMTDGRTLNASATTNSLNGSIDMPFVANALTGTLDDTTFCIQSVELSLNNNDTARTCIGEAAPDSYSSGTAQIGVSISAYLADDNWAAMASKLSQVPFSLGFMVKNADGFYGFFLPAVQISFDDPSSAGANQDIILEMGGVAKVGASGESSLTIYRG